MADYVYSCIAIRLQGYPGHSVQDVARDLMKTARALGFTVVCEINGVDLTVNPLMEMSDIERSYNTLRNMIAPPAARITTPTVAPPPPADKKAEG